MPRDLRQAAAFLFGFWLALVGIGPLGAPRLANGADDAARRLEGDLYDAVNRARDEQGRVPLRREPRLDAVARAHSEDMATRGYFAHVSPDGASPVERLTRAGVEGFSLAAENVGLTSRSDPSGEILRGWLASPTHRTNLLAPAFNATGIGAYRGADGTLYFTQLYLTFPR